MKELEKQFASRPQPPQMERGVEQAVLQKFKALPNDRREILKVAMKHPCSNCEAEFKLPNTGVSHGICKRHAAEAWAALGKPPPETKSQTVDLATLSPEERKLLVYLFTFVRNRRRAKDPKGVHEGRCEDWPCCGHEAGDCPDRDPETGEEIWRCAHCRRPLPRGATSSLCSRCQQEMYRRMDDPTGQDLDDWQQ